MAAAEAPSPPLACNADSSTVSVDGSGEESDPRGSRTLMVTLVGVNGMGGKILVASVEEELCGMASGVPSVARSEGVAFGLSTDMLRYERSPLSSRGRFLVPEESVSSIGLL